MKSTLLKKNWEAEKEQARLKKEYGIEEKSVVIEQRSTTVVLAQLLLKTIASVIRYAAIVAIGCLAFVGLLALAYPESRSVLLLALESGLRDLNLF